MLRVRELYTVALGRVPSEQEISRAIAFVERYGPANATDPTALAGDARCATAWQALCRVILSSNEFLYVE